MTPPVLTLLDTWTSGQSAPSLTWYGPDAERVELSGRVLANWVTKAANLLADEADVTPGTLVQLDLPMHWRTAVWALAVWVCGGTVALPGAEGAGADVLVSSRPSTEGAPLVIAVALPALARAVPDLPARSEERRVGKEWGGGGARGRAKAGVGRCKMWAGEY